MPNTPVAWLPETLIPSTSSGTDADSHVVQLSNGNVLIVWTAFDDGDYDVWGRILDPFGIQGGAGVEIAPRLCVALNPDKVCRHQREEHRNEHG